MSDIDEAPLSRPVVNAVLQELIEIHAEADRAHNALGDWVRDQISYVIVLLKYGDKG